MSPDDEFCGGTEVPREYGNVRYDSSGTKLVWWLLGVVALAAVAEAGWLGSAVIDLKAEVAAINAKVDFLIADRKPLYRGGSGGNP